MNHLNTAKYTPAMLFRRIFHSSFIYPLSILLRSNPTSILLLYFLGFQFWYFLPVILFLRIDNGTISATFIGVQRGGTVLRPPPSLLVNFVMDFIKGVYFSLYSPPPPPCLAPFYSFCARPWLHWTDEDIINCASKGCKVKSVQMFSCKQTNV